MISILAVVHVALSFFLVILVLVQDPKGGGAGGLFGGGGGSNSLFGATGAPTFLAKVTRWVAVVFAASCIAMTIFIKPQGDSVLDKMDLPAASQTEGAQIETAPTEEQTSPEAETIPAEPNPE